MRMFWMVFLFSNACDSVDNSKDTANIQAMVEAPVAVITSPVENGIYYSDQVISFAANVSDLIDAPESLAVRWSSDVDGELSQLNQLASSDGEIVATTLLSQGQHTVSLQVENSRGSSTTTQVSIVVGPPNSAPLCEILAPAENAMEVLSKTIDFMASASDVDVPHDMLKAEWISDLDGVLGNTEVDANGEIAFPYADLSHGIHLISLKVLDELGYSCVDFVSVQVGAPPEVLVHSPAHESIHSEGLPILFSATVADLHDAPSDVVLQWSLQGEVYSTQGADAAGLVEFSDASLGFGEYLLQVQATNTEGYVSTVEQTFIVNALPTPADVLLQPEPAYTANDLQVLASGSTDAEGGAIVYQIEWYVDGAQAGVTTDVVSHLQTTKGEVWTAVVTPFDGIASGPSTEASITIFNTPPTISGVTISPSTGIKTNSSVTCIVSATDDDDGTPSISVNWYNVTTGQTIGNGTTLQLDNSIVSPNDTLSCIAVATDVDGVSVTEAESQIIENTLPQSSSIGLAPAVAFTNDLMMANVSFSDIDGQTVTGNYEWHVIDSGGDTIVQNGTSSTLDGEWYFERDDQVYVIVTPNDGVDDGASMSSQTITISNSEPTIPQIGILPNSPTSGQDDLWCHVITESNDLDQDTVYYTYEWTDPAGVVQQSTVDVAETSDRFPAASTSEGTWSCRVRASDGMSTGNSVTAAVFIENGCSAMRFDDDGYGVDILAGIQNQLQGLAEITLEAWIYNYGPQDQYRNIFRIGDTSTRGIMFRLGASSVSDPNANRLEVLIATTDESDLHVTTSEVPTDQWIHVAASYDGTELQLFVNGNLEATEALTGSVQLDLYGGAYIGYSSYHSSTGYEEFYGKISNARISSVARYTQSFSPGFPFTADSDTVAFWPMNEGQSYYIYDAANTFDGVRTDDGWSYTCPTEDADGDGIAAYLDCDDSNASLAAIGSGSSQACAADSCLDILNRGASTGDGNYWLEPASTGAFQAYCDMTTDGGGWTLVGQGGANCNYASNMANALSSSTQMTDGDSCSYLSWEDVAAVAAHSQEVELRIGTTLFLASESARSLDSLAIDALLSETGTWHNGATWDNWNWQSNCSHNMEGWPNMFHGCGYSDSPHWYHYESNQQSYRAFCYPSTCQHNVSSNWLR